MINFHVYTNQQEDLSRTENRASEKSKRTPEHSGTCLCSVTHAGAFTYKPQYSMCAIDGASTSTPIHTLLTDSPRGDGRTPSRQTTPRLLEPHAPRSCFYYTIRCVISTQFLVYLTAALSDTPLASQNIEG